MNEVTLLREAKPIAELANSAISAIIEGHIDPITAHINLSKMEAAIQQVKNNPDVRDITLRELSKYGKKHSFGDCTLEETEAGVKYDFTECGDHWLESLGCYYLDFQVNIQRRG